MTLSGSPSIAVRARPVLFIASILAMEMLNSLRFSDDTELSGISIDMSISYVDGSNKNISDTVRSVMSVEKKKILIHTRFTVYYILSLIHI